MNTTQYTTEQLRSIIIPSFNYDDVILISEYESQPLIEFNYSEPVIISEAYGKDLITIDFYQDLEYECGAECCGGFIQKYSIILTKEKIDQLLNTL